VRVYAQSGGDYSSPDDCATCHQAEYEDWNHSFHAGSLTTPEFIRAWNTAGKPAYCNTCHATGYDPVSGNVDFGGVGCLSCHDFASETGVPHMTIDRSAEKCGECHTGIHSPDYDQWLVSDHAAAGVECNACHQDHSTDLHMEDADILCQSCHEVEHENNVHGIENLSCVDCHMADGEHVIDTLSGQTDGAGHTFTIPASVCSNCHGMTHTIQADSDSVNLVAFTQTELDTCREESTVEASNRLNMGLTGGGIGGLLVGLSIPFLIRRRENHDQH
jgi:hypothetical protein